MTLLTAPLQLQLALAARFASFVRRRTYEYAFSQELVNRTHQGTLHLTEGSGK